MAPNYAAENMVAGIERTFKGQVVGKALTKWGADAQLDSLLSSLKQRYRELMDCLFFIPELLLELLQNNITRQV